MTTMIDLDAYFERIGYTGERAATLDVLRAVHARHTETIPFENLNPLLHLPVLLDAPSLEKKLVRSGRGGYCYEQNLLLRRVLEELGFRVAGLAARVLWNVPEGTIRGRTHALLRVEIDGASFLADAGFGGHTLTGPIRLEPNVEQSTPHEPYRLLQTSREFLMQSRIHGEWRSLYQFDLQEQNQVDYEIANWYVSTHPSSHFVHDLMAGRAAPGLRYTLHNNEAAVHRLDGTTERRILADAAELREALEDVFLLTLPEAPELDALLTRLTAERV